MAKYNHATPEGIFPPYKWDRFRESGDNGQPFIEVASANDEIVVAKLTWNGPDEPLSFVGYGHSLPANLIEWLFDIAADAIGEP